MRRRKTRTCPASSSASARRFPTQTSPARFRQKFDIRDRFAIYVGRIDENKGCGELFDFFQRYSRLMAEGMHLVLIGTPIIPIPDHPRIHHLGFVSDQDKFDALAAAELLIMPSYLESLSMVALEAWALGKPVLANGHCDVLRGQCIRSNGGLYYENFAEFLETLRAIDLGPALALALGRNGREYFAKHYSWPIIERKYLDMLDRLEARDADEIDGTAARVVRTPSQDTAACGGGRRGTAQGRGVDRDRNRSRRVAPLRCAPRAQVRESVKPPQPRASDRRPPPPRATRGRRGRGNAAGAEPRRAPSKARAAPIGGRGHRGRGKARLKDHPPPHVRRSSSVALDAGAAVRRESRTEHARLRATRSPARRPTT